LINRIEDRYGNQIRFAWDNKEGESYLSKV